ncbi:hydrolase [Aliidiomarina halalkaliphila]|uniref:Hydrolase n=1 Tax=Aliidiomarina halalkaliphila TaxID=2593535 RepID=A0A552X181_9GAMM|nr:hydrolase [Aliidiomarina halalkaliphila]TRW48800.1 hydrolase [Aliidiomarina halalkaliphila]
MTAFTPSQSTLHAAQSLLLIIDIQERLAPAIANVDALIAENVRLLRVAAELQLPRLYTEQYPKGLGATVPSLQEPLAGAHFYEKIHFSAGREPEFRDQLASLGRTQVVVTGTETHVCVLQTVLDLLALEYHVFVVADAVSSRSPENKERALARMAQAGAHVVSSEMVIFEWLERAGTDQFRTISKAYIR